MLITHGANKVFGAAGIQGTASWFESLGVRPGIIHAWAAAVTEIGASALMCVGLLLSAACAAFVGLMTVAASTDHRGKGFFVFKGGYEYVVVVGLIAVSLAVTGPGRWSLDRLAGWNLAGVGWGIAAALVGIAAGVGMVVSFRAAPSRGTWS
jgi:putative oxidoreductase